MITENLSTLKIHKLTQEQYERELEAGRIDENALYLTPDTSNGSYEDQIQSDWNQNDETKADYIKNKPSILSEEDVVGLIEEHGDGGSASVEKAQGYNDNNYEPGTFGIVTTNKPSQYSGLTINDGAIQTRPATTSDIDSIMSMYEEMYGQISEYPGIKSVITPENFIYMMFSALKVGYYTQDFDYITRKKMPGTILAQPGCFYVSGLSDVETLYTNNDYTVCYFKGSIDPHIYTALSTTVCGLEVTKFNYSNIPTGNAPGYHNKYQLSFTIATQSDMEIYGENFELKLPDSVVMLNNVEFQPGTTYLLVFEEIDYQTHTCEIIEITAGTKDYVSKAEITQTLKPKKVVFEDGATITVEDNTCYYAETEISTLNVIYPQTDFICSFLFTIADEGNVTISLPQSKYIGGTPSFANGETWEVNIKDGVVVGGLVE